MRAAIALTVLLAGAPATSAGSVVSDVTVRGEVGSFDLAVVQVIQDTGAVLRIPRRLVPEALDLKPGKRVELKMPLEQFEKLEVSGPEAAAKPKSAKRR